MTITPTTTQATNPLTNAAVTISTVTSPNPFVYVLYNPTTKVIFGKARSLGANAKISSQGAILACDTFANLQVAATVVGLTGILSLNKE